VRSTPVQPAFESGGANGALYSLCLGALAAARGRGYQMRREYQRMLCAPHYQAAATHGREEESSRLSED
jgi:hypothetical protein